MAVRGPGADGEFLDTLVGALINDCVSLAPGGMGYGFDGLGSGAEAVPDVDGDGIPDRIRVVRTRDSWERVVLPLDALAR